MHKIPPQLLERYEALREPIRRRLEEFAAVPAGAYFYELCYCLCTPQSRARNALQVQRILEQRDFLRRPFDPTPLLRDPAHYIRFHNQKARNLLEARALYPEIEAMLLSGHGAAEKRQWLVQRVRGMSMKEASHFLRNIGYRGLAILDRHILKHLTLLGVFDSLPDTGSVPRYLDAEQRFRQLADAVRIPMDELDLLFWAQEAGEILK